MAGALPGQHKIPDGDFISDKMFPDPFIIPFIMSANKHEMFLFRQLLGFLLRITLTLRADENNARLGVRTGCQLFNRIKYRRGFNTIRPPPYG